MSLRKIIHIDMDCFYAAIEVRDFPELADQPVAVGGNIKRRGVITTCNYSARKFGIRSAMATAQAFKRCPHLKLQPIRMDVYREESKRIQAIFSEYTNLIEPLSLDEAFLDVTHATHCQGSATWIAEEIRQRIFTTTKLTASAGIAPNKSLAKIASDWNKPNGIKVIRPEEVSDFVKNLPVRKLFGVGPKMEARLQALNIKNCSDLQKFTLNDLCKRFGTIGKRLYEQARGIDQRPVNPQRIRKSISVEETYPKDLPSIDACMEALPGLLDRLELRMERAANMIGIQTLFVKMKFNDFTQTTVERAVNKIDVFLLRQLIQEAFRRRHLPVRLLGIGIKLQSVSFYTGKQLSLFE